VEISPIDYRYGYENVKEIFSPKYRLKCMLLVEKSVLEVKHEMGMIPENIPHMLASVIDQDIVRFDEIQIEEKVTKHDIMAMINVVNRHAPGIGNYLHSGMTSNDVNDTATALQLKAFFIVYIKRLEELLNTLKTIVKREKRTIMLGRTHGQHASPITFGLKISVFMMEIFRHANRISEGVGRFLAGKIRGPVGTGAGLGDRALEIEEQTLNILGLNVEEASTQIIGRDRYIEMIGLFSNISATLERLATEIRNLQRPEIGEISEGFAKSTQVGSSAMPSKMNPVKSENVCSLARMIRSYLTPEIEGSILWHERDLTNSALERFTIPYSCILIDYITGEMTDVLRNLVINRKRMKTNLKKDPFSMSEAVVIALANSGIPRDEAHEIVRKSAMYSDKATLFVKNIVDASGNKISTDTIQKALDPSKFLGSAVKICDNSMRTAAKTIRSLQKLRENLIS
jgi:adenylosuccinate lyase